MPNWCSNVLIVEGPPSDVSAFVNRSTKKVFIDWEHTYRDIVRKARKTKSIIGKLKLSAHAAEYRKENSHIGMFAAHYPPPDDVVACGYDSAGYDWCVKKWGTKWDAGPNIDYSEGSTSARFTFESAWAPPIPWLAVVSGKWPHLRFTLGYYESGVGFYGYAVYENGVHTDGDRNEAVRHHDCLDEWLDKPIRNSEDFISLYQKTAATVQGLGDGEEE